MPSRRSPAPRSPDRRQAIPRGLLPLRRAAAPLEKGAARGAGRRVSIAARASLGEFPAWDAVNDAAINLHASVIASDLVISDAAAAVDTEEIVGLQKGGWLGPITNALEFTLEVRVGFLRVAHERALGAVPHRSRLEPRRPERRRPRAPFPSSLRRFSGFSSPATLGCAT